jgi:hypothetical protein
MEFDQDILVGPSNNLIRLFESDGTEVTQKQADIAGTVVNGNTLRFSLEFDLVETTSYYINIDAGAIYDATGTKNFAGIADNTTWTFTTQAEPVIISTLIPADNSSAVSVGQTFQAVFSQNISLSTSGSTAELRRLDNDEVVDSELEVVGGFRFNINPVLQLETATDYYIHIDPGFIIGANGEVFAGITDKTTWNFTTSATDNLGPSIVSVTPANGTTGFPVDENIVIVFDEDVFSDIRDVTLRPTGFPSLNFDTEEDGLTINGNVVTINPKFHLPGNNDIDLIIDPAFVQDASGNGNNSQPLLEFTTGAPIDVTAPSIVSVSPTGNGVNRDGAALELSITYDEPVRKLDQ